FSAWLSSKFNGKDNMVTALHNDLPGGILELGIETDGFRAHPKIDDAGYSVISSGSTVYSLNYELSKVTAVQGSFSQVGLYPSIGDYGPPPDPKGTTDSSSTGPGKGQLPLTSGDVALAAGSKVTDIINPPGGIKDCPEDKPKGPFSGLLVFAANGALGRGIYV